jgi:choline dehydrogenase-like flavoprotein
MGPADDPGAVVDERCAVHGLENLHVVDASIMPSMVCANTHLSVVMIGERAAALLRDANGTESIQSPQEAADVRNHRLGLVRP